MLSKHCDPSTGRVYWPEEILNIYGIILNVSACYNCADQRWIKGECHHSVVSLDMIKLYFLLLVVINGE